MSHNHYSPSKIDPAQAMDLKQKLYEAMQVGIKIKPSQPFTDAGALQEALAKEALAKARQMYYQKNADQIHVSEQDRLDFRFEQQIRAPKGMVVHKHVRAQPNGGRVVWFEFVEEPPTKVFSAGALANTIYGSKVLSPEMLTPITVTATASAFNTNLASGSIGGMGIAGMFSSNHTPAQGISGMSYYNSKV